MNISRLYIKQQLLIICALFSLTFLATNPALASGFYEGASVSNTIKLDPFVVNLAAYDKFLQTTITLQLDTPEVGEKVKSMMPKIKHVIIVTLSSKEADSLRTSEGKKALISELKTKINKAINGKANEGIGDIFLENFVIQ
jgi:flagellar basal body-associated protein FliL